MAEIPNKTASRSPGLECQKELRIFSSRSVHNFLSYPGGIGVRGLTRGLMIFPRGASFSSQRHRWKTPKRTLWQCTDSVCVVGVHRWDLLRVSSSVECDLSVLSYLRFFLSIDEVRRQTNQPLLTEIIQARRLTLFGHIARMDDNLDAKQILTSSPLCIGKDHRDDRG